MKQYEIFSALIGQKTVKNIFIYGAGAFGREIFSDLGEAGIKITAFLDRKAETIKHVGDCPVLCLEDTRLREYKEHTVVLFAIVMDLEERAAVINEIKEHGFLSVINAQLLRCRMVCPDDQGDLSTEDYYSAKSDVIAQARRLFSESKSLRIFDQTVDAHRTGAYTEFPQDEDHMCEQYFPADLSLYKGYSTFIDCGGYTGDTVHSLLRMTKDVDLVISFEPNIHNFSRLSETCSSFQQQSCRFILYPCAVSGQTQFCKFKTGNGSGFLSESGGTDALSVSLDSVMKGIHPTFIKMDIEGAELKAVRGAHQLICRNKPDLAICVYHNVNHIWDIPLLLHGWELGYQFYLRTYNACTMETVLYATTNQQ